MSRAFSLYICDRSKVCLYHRDWIASSRDTSLTQTAHDFITTYGLCFQMKLFTTAADPTKPVGSHDDEKADGMRPTPIGEGTAFRCVCYYICSLKHILSDGVLEDWFQGMGLAVTVIASPATPDKQVAMWCSPTA